MNKLAALILTLSLAACADRHGRPPENSAAQHVEEPRYAVSPEGLRTIHEGRALAERREQDAFYARWVAELVANVNGQLARAYEASSYELFVAFPGDPTFDAKLHAAELGKRVAEAYLEAGWSSVSAEAVGGHFVVRLRY